MKMGSRRVLQHLRKFLVELSEVVGKKLTAGNQLSAFTPPLQGGTCSASGIFIFLH